MAISLALLVDGSDIRQFDFDTGGCCYRCYLLFQSIAGIPAPFTTLAYFSISER